MRIQRLAAAVIIAAPTALSSAAFAAVPMVGGAPMYPTKTIPENASQAKNLTTLVAAVKAGGLVDTLSGPGPFTVFAPTNRAFSELPSGTVPTLLKPENKAKLDQVLTYHVVPGKLTMTELKQEIATGGGKAMLKTVEGDMLTITDPDGKLMVTDAQGGTARVVGGEVPQANGMVYVVNKVLMP